jgi:peptidoglycan/xylan/chitin deacetylase (PgdA/CDA1 family)
MSRPSAPYVRGARSWTAIERRVCKTVSPMRPRLYGAACVIVSMIAATAAVGVEETAGTGHAGLAAVALASSPMQTGVVHLVAPGRGKTVALTFDDGPGASTRAILTILEARQVHGTFFNLGMQLADHVRPLRREVRLSEALGNHTWDPRDMTSLTRSEQAAEMDRTTRKMTALVEVRPHLFRPPFGAYNRITRILAAKRLLAFWLWSVDTEDGKAAGSASSYWVHRIVTRAEAGVTQTHPVILMHNGARAAPATVLALPRIITFYRRHGYRFVVL